MTLSAETNGHADEAEAVPRLKRAVYFDRVTELLDAGMSKPDAFEQVAQELGTTASNISGGYYSERKHRLTALTEGVDPASVIMEALASVEEALADAKLRIASATMQFETLREQAAKYAELRKQFL